MKELSCDFVFMTHAIQGEARKLFNSDWDGLYPRNTIIKTIATRLKAPSRVLCVERPVSPFLTPLLHYSKFKRWVLRKDILRPIVPNLDVFTACTFLPDSLPIRSRIVTAVNRMVLGCQLRRVMKKRGFVSRKRVLWVYHPHQLESLDFIDEDIVVYECHDEYTSSEKGNAERGGGIVAQKEKLLLKRADVVFTTSRLLYEKKGKYNTNTHYIPNAADVGHFKKAQDPATEESPKTKNIRRPIIGYLGLINENTDIALLSQIAAARPDWSLVMVGSLQMGDEGQEPVKKFASMPNVHMLGWVDYDELPKIAKSFSACVIPYRADMVFNQNINPNKLHEYTAMGKPIVSTDIQEAHTYGDIIEIAGTCDDFIALLEKSIREDSPEKVHQRLEMAEKNSWGERVEKMLSVIADTIEQHDGR